MNNLDPIAVFRLEAAECLEVIEAGLLDLTDDLSNKDLVDSVFRGLHTLKGSGSMFGFDALAAFTHHCETAFDRVRKGLVSVTPELIATVLDARDHMRDLLDHPHGENVATGQALLARLHSAVSDQENASDKRMAKPTKTWRIRFRLALNALTNGVKPLGLLDEIRSLGECDIRADLTAIPPIEQLIGTDLHLAWDVTLTTEHGADAINDVFVFVIDDMQLDIQDISPASAEPLETGTVRIDDPSINGLPGKPAVTSQAGPAKATENVRVPAERLDELMDRVGELVIAQSRLSQLATSSADSPLRSVSEEIDRLSGELRNTMMVLRMVPVSTLFSRFRRLTHDLARETGKTIELVTHGETTEVDKTVIERLADPLVHLVRNSIDHGLELPQERAASGKSQSGTVSLSAHQAGGEVVISIKDDGRGIDRERVREKAERSGLIAVGQTLTDQELLQLIFAPGFSTAEKVTSLSGRGVGMDVVKRTVDALRGAITVSSQPGQGSEVTLRIPLTLAIIDGLLVRVGASRFVIPLSAVEECLELSIESDLRSRGRSFISLRDQLVPYLRLRDVFATGTEPDLHQKIVVVSTGTERVGVVVDQIIGDHQTVIKAMSKLHRMAISFSGATILGDGGVALILDVGNLVATGQQQEAQMRMAG